MKVYVTDRLASSTAHQRLDCTFLTRRDFVARKPVELEAIPVTPLGQWVEVRVLLRTNQVKVRTIRLCARCGK